MNCKGVLLLLASGFFVTVASQCTFPTSLQGTWVTNTRNLTFTSSILTDYSLGIFGSHAFDCDQVYSGRYILKSQNTITASSLVLYAYLCFDFTYINSNLYSYFIASNETVGIQMLLEVHTQSPNPADVCAKSASQYDPTTFEVMIKDGDGVAAKTTCPTDIVATWNYEIDSGSGNTCNPAGELEGCTASELSANYTTCNTPVFYSSSGLVYCLASVTSGSLTYLVVYNSDATVDGTTTFRLACLVYELVGSTVYMSQYPTQFESTQTGISVTTPTGSLLTFSNKVACPTTPTSSQDMTIYIILGGVGGFLLLFIIAIIIILVLTWKAKKRLFRGKLQPEGFDDNNRRMNAFQNGFKRIKHPGELDRPHDRDGSPEDDTPINVMQLLRKDIISGGRDSPSSNVLLSVTTPNPYSLHDADSIGGTSVPVPPENPSLRKHYHVIGGERSVAGGLEERDEEGEDSSSSNNSDATEDNDGGMKKNVKAKPRKGSTKSGSASKRSKSGKRIGSGHRAGSASHNKTPVMVMPVRSDGSDLFDGDGDDLSDDALNEADGEGSVVVSAAVRQGVGISSDGSLPPPRLPPIDEGPASHRSVTGAGSKTIAERIRTVGPDNSMNTTTITSSIIHEEEDSVTTRAEGESDRCQSLPVRPHFHPPHNGHFKVDGNLTMAIPNLVEQVDMGSGPVDEKDTEKWTLTGTGGAQGGRLPRNILSAGARRNSNSRGNTRSARSSRPKSKTSRGRNPKDEDWKPQCRDKVTRVDIPELRPAAEAGEHARGETELPDFRGQAYRNAAYQGEMDDTAADKEDGTVDGTPQKLWRKPNIPSQDVWSQVSKLWRKAQSWADNPTHEQRPDPASGV